MEIDKITNRHGLDCQEHIVGHHSYGWRLASYYHDADDAEKYPDGWYEREVGPPLNPQPTHIAILPEPPLS